MGFNPFRLWLISSVLALSLLVGGNLSKGALSNPKTTVTQADKLDRATALQLLKNAYLKQKEAQLKEPKVIKSLFERNEDLFKTVDRNLPTIVKFYPQAVGRGYDLEVLKALDQLVAAGFLKNKRSTQEGGNNPFTRYEYEVADASVVRVKVSEYGVKIILAREVIDETTGIPATPMMGNDTVVEATTRMEETEFGKQLRNFILTQNLGDSRNWQDPLELWKQPLNEELKPRNAQFRFRKYDDGWRVVSRIR